MKLQVSTQLAIFAIVELVANADRQLTVAEIGDKFKVSSHHLAKVMKVLGRANLVRAIRGAGGGYQFSGNARRTTLLEVIELFENLGPGDPASAALGEDTGAAVVLQLVLGEIHDIARATLGSITLATMCALIDRNSPQPTAAVRRPGSASR